MIETTVLEKKGKVTWDEFRNMELDDNDPYIYELLNGIIMKRSAPSLFHQKAARNLTTDITNFLRLNPLGEVYPSPVDVELDKYNAFQPDIAFVSVERSFLYEDGDYIRGAPDLIVEIISPGNARRDRVDKKEICEQFAVREYWLIDPLSQTVEIYVMRDNAYHLHDFLEQTGKATSTVLKGFEVEISALFS
jgi:Uma2 family endonuclease